MKQWQILLFILFIYYICIEVEFPYLGGEGGSQGLTRKNRPCVPNSLSEDPLDPVQLGELRWLVIGVCQRQQVFV